DFEVYRTLAKIHRLKLIPRFVIEDERGLSGVAPTLLAEQVAAVGADGIFLDMGGMVSPAMPRLAGWLQQCGETLSARGLELLMQMPGTLDSRMGVSSLLAVTPHGRLVLNAAAATTNLPVRFIGKSVVREEIPASPDAELPVSYMIPGLAGTEIEETVQGRTSRLMQNGMAAFQDREYDAAIRFWSEWLELEPDNPRALMLLGDAKVQRGDFAAALIDYERSLEIDPGQISLALRRARLLDDLGRTDEALHSLNLYARIFPEDDRVRMAQSEWLIRKHRFGEALKVIRGVVQRDPENVEALALWLRMEEDPVESHRAMKALMVAGEKPEKQVALGQAVTRHDLLTLPNAGPLIKLSMDLSRTSPDPNVQALFAPFIPRAEKTIETFAGGQISGKWMLEGGSMGGAPGRVKIKTGERNTEASLKLQGSLHAYDGFVECVVSPGEGSFWLFARRSGDQLVRFGYSGDRLHLQAWRQGRIVSSESVSWSPPSGPVRLGLEVSGRGAMGHVNGKPVFSGSLSVPPMIGRGWIGVALHDPERGRASAELQALMAGPLQPRFAKVGAVSSEEQAEEKLQVVRRLIRSTSVLCTGGYEIDARGNLTRTNPDPDDLWRLFAQYYRVWYMPVLQVKAGTPLDSVLLQEKARDWKVDGFVLLLDSEPDPGWMRDMREAFMAADICVVAGTLDSEKKTARFSGWSGAESSGRF
ncbi:MAG: tetratricopeptide repeat protein, partial [Kiritimatiellia bacterium]|nr:tetratricopeptide repeat protein [Kiritimatiellia bacterium]